MKMFITLFAIWIGYTYSYETVYTTSVQMIELNFFQYKETMTRNCTHLKLPENMLEH